jgi:hypothetical protein
MPQQAAFGFEQLVTEILRGLIEAVADRPGETEAQRFVKQQTAVFSTMAFLPRDAAETMLASQCVMIDHLLRDATRDMLRGESERIKLRIRSQLIAMGRLFLKHLEQLRQFQARPVDQIAVSPRAEAEPRTGAAQKPGPGQQTANAATPPRASALPDPPPVDAQMSQAPSANAEPVPAQSHMRFRDSQPAPTSSQPQETQSGGKTAHLLQRGFQNRRMRRSLQFKKPAGQPVRTASSPGSAGQEVAASSSAGSGLTGR